MSTNNLDSVPAVTLERIHAKAAGYSFAILDEKWVLDKNVTINVKQVAVLLAEPTKSGFLNTLAFYASELSSSHTKNVLERFQHMLRSTGTSEMSDVVLINYRAMLTPTTE